MQIRPITSADLTAIRGIDAVIESTDYLHVDQSGESLSVGWRLETRPLREKTIESNPVSDTTETSYKHIVGEIEEGIALAAEHEGELVGSLLAIMRPDDNLIELIDLRIDYDYRRQGLATVMLFNLIEQSRQRQERAVFAQTTTKNHPAALLLQKIGFHLSGIDVRRQSNHDLVKESATLLWYLELT